MDRAFISEEDAIGWLTAISNNLPKTEENIPFLQALEEIINTIDKLGFKKPKVFISQSMKGLSKDEIIENRQKAIEVIKNNLGEVEIIDSFFKDDRWEKINEKAPDKEQNRRVYFLGESLKLLAQADCVVFLDGYQQMSGCLSEEFVAKQYCIQMYHLIGDELRPVSC